MWIYLKPGASDIFYKSNHLKKQKCKTTTQEVIVRVVWNEEEDDLEESHISVDNKTM